MNTNYNILFTVGFVLKLVCNFTVFSINVLREVLNYYLHVDCCGCISWLLITSWKTGNTLLVGNILLLQEVDQVIIIVIIACILNIF